ncbi:MAG: GspE/PulE family protein [Planctomycetota bacterium]|jgi:type IV pilus assembly protein PilB
MKLPFAFEKKQDSTENEYKGHSAPEFSEEANCLDDQSIQGLSDLYFPEEADESHVHGIIDVLVDMGKLTSGQCMELRQQCRRAGSTLDSDIEAILLKEGLVGTEDILMAKAELYGLELRRIKAEDVEKEVLNKSGLDIDFIKSNLVCPVAIEEGMLVVGTNEPGNVFAIEDVKRRSQIPVQMVVCSVEDIEAVCDSFKSDEVDYCVDDIINDMVDLEVVQDEEDISENLEEMAGQSPVIKFVNYLISNAIHEGASDIHIEPKDKFTKIRYRIDGVLFETMQSPLKMHPAIVSRIKIMSNLDISERRLPQDGKISVIVGGRAIDLRK